MACPAERHYPGKKTPRPTPIPPEIFPPSSLNGSPESPVSPHLSGPVPATYPVVEGEPAVQGAGRFPGERGLRVRGTRAGWNLLCRGKWMGLGA